MSLPLIIQEAIREIHDQSSLINKLLKHLSLGQRPFELWAAAEEDFNKACELIPDDWIKERRELW